MDIQHLSNNLKTLTAAFEPITDKFHTDHAADYIDLNQEAMDMGEDAVGAKLPTYSNKAYEKWKTARGGKSGGHWNLDLYGGFRAGMKMNNRFEIFSTDSKADKLVDLTNSNDNDIFGVQPKRLDQYAKDQLIPEFNDLMLKKLMQ